MLHLRLKAADKKLFSLKIDSNLGVCGPSTIFNLVTKNGQSGNLVTYSNDLAFVHNNLWWLKTANGLFVTLIWPLTEPTAW